MNFNFDSESQQMPLIARASVVNRTHRIIRERALEMRESRNRKRSLWVPIAIFSVLLPIICLAIWMLMDGYDITPNGIPDASDQLLLLMVWSLPLTIVLFGLVWFQRQRNQGEVSK